MMSLAACMMTGGAIKGMAQSGIRGSVYEDLNRNGKKDPGEPGVKGIAVSDQVNVVTSGADGSYSLAQTKNYGIVSISLPDGYQLGGPFWRAVDPGAAAADYDFPLLKTRVVTTFSFIHASDTHISPASLDRMKKFEKKTDSIKPDFVIITGDLVKDALRVGEKEARSLYDLFQQEVPHLTATTWLIPGNHENFGIERHLSLVSADNPLYGKKMYRHYFGPDYYSFNYGGIHFVGLNSLSFEDLWYYGNIDSVQLEWMKKDIALLPPQTPIVTFQHVPFFSGGLSLQPFEDAGPGRVLEREKGVLQYRHIVSNADEVINALKGHNYPLALAGHYHYQQRFSMAGVQTRFEQTGAVVAPTAEGPFKMPSGIVVYTVKDGKIDEGKFVPLD